jgi:hypothetical protein
LLLFSFIYLVFFYYHLLGFFLFLQFREIPFGVAQLYRYRGMCVHDMHDNVCEFYSQNDTYMHTFVCIILYIYSFGVAQLYRYRGIYVCMIMNVNSAVIYKYEVMYIYIVHP